MRGSLRSLVPATYTKIVDRERHCGLPRGAADHIFASSSTYWELSVVLFMGAVADDGKLGLDMPMV